VRQGPLRIWCDTCQAVRDASLSGYVAGIANGCDSCGHGASVSLVFRIACDAGHEAWSGDGQAAGITGADGG
jgi:hypothetical protein